MRFNDYKNFIINEAKDFKNDLLYHDFIEWNIDQFENNDNYKQKIYEFLNEYIDNSIFLSDSDRQIIRDDSENYGGDNNSADDDYYIYDAIKEDIIQYIDYELDIWEEIHFLNYLIKFISCNDIGFSQFNINYRNNTFSKIECYGHDYIDSRCGLLLKTDRRETVMLNHYLIDNFPHLKNINIVDYYKEKYGNLILIGDIKEI